MKRVQRAIGILIVTWLLLPGTLISQAKPWELVGPEGGPLQALAQSSVNPSILLAASPPSWPPSASGGDLFRSTDHGETWLRCSTVNATKLFFDPLDAMVAYAFTYDSLGRSTDGGVTWVWSSLEIPPNHYIADIALDPSDRTVIHAVGQMYDTYTTIWCPLYMQRTTIESKWTYQMLDLSWGICNTIAIESSNPQNIYIGGVGNTAMLWKSTNGGTTFSSTTLAVLEGLDIITVDPVTPGRLFAATWSGILMSTDSGSSWIKNNSVLPHPTSLCVVGGVVYAATFEGVYRSTDGLSYTLLAGSDYGRGEPASMRSLEIEPQLCVEPSTPHTISLSNKAGILKSTDAGKTWSTSNRGLTCGSIQALRCAPSEPTTLFAAKDLDAVYKTSAGSSTSVTWERLKDFYSCNGVTEIAISPVNPNVIYVFDGGG